MVTLHYLLLIQEPYDVWDPACVNMRVQDIQYIFFASSLSLYTSMHERTGGAQTFATAGITHAIQIPNGVLDQNYVVLFKVFCTQTDKQTPAKAELP